MQRRKTKTIFKRRKIFYNKNFIIRIIKYFSIIVIIISSVISFIY
nr:MAG TPA: hypothetical protein [Bacteriophage sp.]